MISWVTCVCNFKRRIKNPVLNLGFWLQFLSESCPFGHQSLFVLTDLEDTVREITIKPNQLDNSSCKQNNYGFWVHVSILDLILCNHSWTDIYTHTHTNTMQVMKQTSCCDKCFETSLEFLLSCEMKNQKRERKYYKSTHSKILVWSGRC